MSTLARDVFGVQPVEIGRRAIEYPFRANGDTSSIVVKRMYKQAPDNYVPAQFGTPDNEFPDAYLVEESDPVLTSTGLFVFERSFARIPATQTVPGTVAIAMPTPSTGSGATIIGSYIVAQPDTTRSIYDAYPKQAIMADSGGSTASPSGGTYSLSFGGVTSSSLAYNATASQVQTALNALTPIANRGGVTVSGSYTSGFTITFGTTQDLYYNGYSITRSGGLDNTSYLKTNGGYTYSRSFFTTTGGATFTGGTFKHNYYGLDSVAIAYNATTSQVATALASLVGSGTASVICTSTNGAGGTILNAASNNIDFNITLINATITVNTGALVGGTGSVASNDSYGSIQTLSFAGTSIVNRDLTVYGHGITTADAIAVLIGSTYYLIPSGNFAVPDVNTIRLTSASGGTLAAAGTATYLGKRTKQGYTAVSRIVRATRETVFYLPGVSSGITTASDIPIPDSQGDSYSIMDAAFSGSGTLNYQVGEQTQWKGPIVSVTTTKVNASDL